MHLHLDAAHSKANIANAAGLGLPLPQQPFARVALDLPNVSMAGMRCALHPLGMPRDGAGRHDVL